MEREELMLPCSVLQCHNNIIIDTHHMQNWNQPPKHQGTLDLYSYFEGKSYSIRQLTVRDPDSNAPVPGYILMDTLWAHVCISISLNLIC
jgi:hypothetical protein